MVSLKWYLLRKYQARKDKTGSYEGIEWRHSYLTDSQKADCKERTRVRLTAICGKESRNVGSGGGSDGRAVASDSTDPQFESQHRAKFYLPIVIKYKRQI